MPGENEPTGFDATPARDVREAATVVHSYPVTEADPAKAGDSSAPPTSFASLDEFCQALVEIGLISATELESFASDSAEGVLGLSRALVKAGKLTPYQAAAVYQKKSRGLLIGNYVILDKLGQGGMGVVFKARHRRLGRVGALKILPPSFARDRDAVMRFRREVEAAGRLKHPNLVAAQDADEDRGVHFLVMDYVEGRDLDRIVQDRGPMQVSQVVDCLIQAARGLEAAHAQGIIHRDIKPGNLMLDSAGTVRVLDLGLARIVDAGNPFGKSVTGRLTQSGMYMGTIDYMAPEQAEDSHRVDHRADIYSLGCTLYYLLTGREPFPAETVLKRLMAHMERTPPSLRVARPDVPPALDRTYEKMMAKRPEERPASMAELISLLEAAKSAAATDGTTTQAPPKSKPELKVFNEAPLKRVGAPRAKDEQSIFARPKEDEGLFIESDLALEDLIMDVRPEAPATPLQPAPRSAPKSAKPLKRSATTRSRPERRPIVIAALAVAGTAVLGGLVWGFIYVNELWYGRQHQNILKLKQEGLAASENTVDRGTETTGRETPKPAVRNETTTTIFDGKSRQGWIISTTRDPVPAQNIQADGLNPHDAGGYLVAYNQKLGDFVLDFDYKLSQGCNSGVFLRVSDLSNPINTSIEVQLSNQVGIGTGLHDTGGFFDLVAPQAQAQRGTGEWNHMTITADGPRVAVTLNDTPVSQINLDEWTVPGTRPDGSQHRFKDVAIANLARTGYVGFQDQGRDCWFKNIVLKTGVSSAIASPSVPKPTLPKDRPADAPGEQYVETARFVGHADQVEAVRVSPDGKRLVTTSIDRTARLWDITTGRELRRLGHPAGVRPVALFTDGRRAVTGCHDGVVRLWDLETAQLVRPLAKHLGIVWAVAVSPDGRSVLSGGDDHVIRLSDVETGTEKRQFLGTGPSIFSLAFSADGKRFLAGDRGGGVWVGELNGSAPPVSLTEHRPNNTTQIYDVAFAGDSRHGLSESFDSFLTYWELDSKTALRGQQVADHLIRAVAFDPERHRVIFSGQRGVRQVTAEGVIGVWDVLSNDPPRLGPRHAAHFGLALLPSGAIATADIDGIARIWQPLPALAHARELVAAGKRSEALAEYGMAVTARPSDASLLIERGRLLTELGRASEADADFSRAAELAPDNPQLFLSAGWWVAGTYPHLPPLDIKAETKSQPASDPSQPPPPSGGRALAWRTAPVEILGAVDLKKIYNSEDAWAHALAIVHVAARKDVVFLMGIDDAAVIWLNGRPIFDHSGYASNYMSHAVPVTLEAGRNTIFAKVLNGKGPWNFQLLISDGLADFVRAYAGQKKWQEAAAAYQKAVAADPAIGDAKVHTIAGTTFAELGRFKDAAAAFSRAMNLEPDNSGLKVQLLHCYLALAEYAPYQAIIAKMFAGVGKNSDPKTINDLSWYAALIPAAFPNGNYGAIMPLADKIVAGRNVSWQRINTYGALLYRARHYQGAITYLNQSIAAQKGKGSDVDWVFMAMALHRLKQPGDTDALKKAAALANDPGFGWIRRVQIRALLKEARMELELPAEP
jgi:serine/threonine protein kinase/tetratricopeptide (TPR) repeat protein